MAVTFTIKEVPDHVADGIRRRAAENRRSMQRELLLIIERAAAGDAASAEPVPRAYASSRESRNVVHAGRSSTPARASSKLTLAELWERARALGASTPSEAATIVRRDRDEGRRR